MIVELIITGLAGLTLLSGIRIVRPTDRAVIETMGKYSRFASAGFNYIVPLFQKLISLNVTEQMVEVESQEIITKDKLNASVDLIVFFKVKSDEQSIKNALYNVDRVEKQITTLAQTTARNVIGEIPFESVNSKRNELNTKLQKILENETKSWGIQIVRVELKEIVPPQDVQATMNQVIKAENEKTSAIDFATAEETKADGIKRASIKEAEGLAQGKIIVAEATAKAIKLVNESANKYFKGNAQKLKQLEVTENSLSNNSKIILGADNKQILKLFDVGK